MKLKDILTYLFFLTLSALLVTTSVSAATSATVTATVTAQNVSVSVTDGSVAYGTLSLNTSAGTNATDTQTATNDGNVTEDLNIRGQNSASWTLAATSGSEQYVHQFCTATCGTPPTNYTALTTSNQTLATSVAASGNQTFDLYITTPTSTADYTQQSVDVIVQASAS